MARFAFYASIGLGALLLVPTIYLVVVNWSPKVIQPLLSVFFGGVIAAFIGLSFILKQASVSERFPVPVVVETTTNLPPRLPIGAMPPTLGSMADKANREEVGAGNVQQRKVDFKSGSDRIAFYSELVQYQIIQQIFGILRYSEGISSSTSPNRPTVVTFDVFDLRRPKQFTKIEGEQVLKILSRNRFMQTSDKIFWEDRGSWLPVPRNSFLRAPDSTSIILERPGYYRATIKIRSLGAAHGCSEQLADVIGSRDVETLGFVVSTDAVFDKFTSGSAYTEETKEWVDSLFRRLKSDFAGSQKSGDG